MTLKRTALLLLMAVAFAEGLFQAWAILHPALSREAVNLYFAASLFATMFLVFAWLRDDERDYRYRRSTAMNIGIAGLAIVFLPMYLVRSRPKGKRLKAVGLLLASFIGMYACSVAGVIAMVVASGARFH